MSESVKNVDMPSNLLKKVLNFFLMLERVLIKRYIEKFKFFETSTYFKELLSKC